MVCRQWGLLVYLTETECWVLLVKRYLFSIELKRWWHVDSLRCCHGLVRRLMQRLPFAKKYVVIDHALAWIRVENNAKTLSGRQLMSAYKMWPEFQKESWSFDVKSIGSKSYLVSAIKEKDLMSIMGPLGGIHLDYVGVLAHCQGLMLQHFLRPSQQSVFFLERRDNTLFGTVIMRCLGVFRSQVTLLGGGQAEAPRVKISNAEALQEGLSRLIMLLQLQCPVSWQSCVVMDDLTLLHAVKSQGMPIQAFNWGAETAEKLVSQGTMRLHVLLSCVKARQFFRTHLVPCE